MAQCNTSSSTMQKRLCYRNYSSKGDNFILLQVSSLNYLAFTISTPQRVFFGVTEGHWPHRKYLNTVLLMLHHFLHCDITPRHEPPKINFLKMHADSCASQNKNRFVLFYLCWRTVLNLNEKVSLESSRAGKRILHERRWIL